MPAYTSARSGYWSDPATWGGAGVPKEGDTATIAAGHTVIFDTDQSGFPNGLAGLTINGTLLIPSLNDPSYPEVGEDTSGTPWLTGWSYRRTVIVDNSFSSTALTNYQIIIRLNTAYLIQQGKMRSDCGDIRVTDSSGNLLPIWIDPATKNFWSTKIYVRVPSIPANGTVTLYLFYGNPDATDVSDGSATFDFFDDFLGTTLDTTKWTAARWTGTGTWSVTVNNGYVEINTGSGTRAGIVSRTAFALPFIVEGSFRYVSGDQVWNSITQTAGGSHNDLVEHGYGSTGGTYFYRRASGGTYTNYQSFGRLAPRGVFAYFRQEWTTSSSRYFEYLPYEGQVNSTTTQDRYTSGNSYIQLSTINGVAQWDWVAVRKFAATPPAVYFRTLTTTTLKVNANIAGSGSFLIGSSSYSINYPQKVVVMVNGQITVAGFSVYGQTEPTYFTYLASDAPANSTTITLLDNLNLNAGDLIAIGRTDLNGNVTNPSEPRTFIFTVQSYDPTTKTVTLLQALPQAKTATTTDLDGNVIYRCLVFKVSRTVELVKYGANNVTFLVNAPTALQGALFYATGTISRFIAPAASTTFEACVFAARISGSGLITFAVNYNTQLSFNNCGFVNTGGSVDWGNYTFSYCYGINSDTGYSDDSHGGPCTYLNSVFQNFGTFHATSGSSQRAFNSAPRGSYLRIEGCRFMHGGWVATGLLQGGLLRNSDFISLIGVLSDCKNFMIDTVRVVSPTASDILGFRFAFNRIERSVLRNVKVNGGAILHYSSGCDVINCAADNHLSLVSSGNRFYNCEYRGLNPSHNLTFRELGRNFFKDITTHISLTTLHSFPSWSDRSGFHPFVYVDFVNINNDNRRRRIFVFGRVEESSTTPNTFSFYLSSTSFQFPIYYDFVVALSSQIVVSGTITQLGSGEQVKVQIFSEGKEPFLGDTPDYEQTYTATGDINISWTPPSAGTWIVRVLAYPQQTTNPITIQNLQVAGGGAGDGAGGGQTYYVNVSDSVTPTLSDSATLTNSLNLSDGISATLSDQATLSAPISLSDNLSPTLSDSGAISAAISTSDNIAPTLQDSANLTHSLVVSDSLAPTLSDSAQANAQISATDNLNPTLSENVSAGNIYQIGVSDQITSTLSDSGAITGQVSATESISPTLSESVTAGNIYEIGISDQVTPTLSDSGAITGQVNATENITPTLQDSGGAQVQITQTEAISPTIQEAPLVGAALSVSDTVAPTLQDSGQISAQVATTETITPTLQENVTAGNVYNVEVSDGVTATLSETVTEQANVAATDSIAPTLAEDVFAGNIYDISVADNVSPSLTENVTEQATVNMQDTINATLAEQVGTTPQISVSENITPTLQENVSAPSSYSLSISEQIAPTLQETASMSAQVSAAESIQPSLSDSAAISSTYSVTVSDAISPTVTENIAETAQVSASETIAPMLGDQATTQIGISPTDTVGVTFQEAASAAAQVSVSDATSVTLTSAPSTSVGAAVSETIQPTITEQVSPQATIMAQEVTDITATETATTEVSTAVSESYAVAVTDTPIAQPVISVTEETSLTASEEIRQFTGWNYIIIEPLDVNVHGEEIGISVEEEEIEISG